MCSFWPIILLFIKKSLPDSLISIQVSAIESEGPLMNCVICGNSLVGVAWGPDEASEVRESWKVTTVPVL